MTAPSAPPAAATAIPSGRLLLLYVGTSAREVLRIPIVLGFTIAFPVMLFGFFAIPVINDNPQVGPRLLASVLATAVMAVAIFQFGVGIAEERRSPWEPYLRTLPAPAWTVVASRIIVVILLALLGVSAVVALAVPLAGVTLAPAAVPALLGGLVFGAVPVSLIGIAIGYGCGPKVAIGVAQLVFFPLLFLGGLLGSIDSPPELLGPLSPYILTRNWAEIVWAAAAAEPWPLPHVLSLLAWVPVTAALALLVVRRENAKYT